MFIVFVGLRKVPNGTLWLIVAATTQDRRAGVFVDVFILSLIHIYLISKDTFNYDPANPVPTLGGPLCCDCLLYTSGVGDGPGGRFRFRHSWLSGLLR